MSHSQDHDSDTTSSAHTEEIEKSLREVVSLGRLWASYGLTAGKQALEVCARTHTVAAQFLGDLAEHVTPDRPTDAR